MYSECDRSGTGGEREGVKFDIVDKAISVLSSINSMLIFFNQTNVFICIKMKSMKCVT